ELAREPKDFRLRIRLQDRPAADDLFALAEGAVGGGQRPALEANPEALLAGRQPARIDEASLPARLLDELAHRLHQGGGGRQFAIFFRAADETEVLHAASPNGGFAGATNESGTDRHALVDFPFFLAAPNVREKNSMQSRIWRPGSVAVRGPAA